MVMISNTFDATKGYKRIRFLEDRDLLDTELNELQEIAIYERRTLLDRVYAQGTILDGLTATGNGTTLTVTDGLLYLDGHAVRVPGTTLTCSGTGVHTVWVDVFRRAITVADDAALVNPLTGEPTAEREKWIATLQTRDTSGDPLPTGATGRTVVAILTYHPTNGTITRLQPRPLAAGDAALLDDHEARLDAQTAAVSALEGQVAGQGTAINTLDGQLDTHIGAGGPAHATVTPSQAGFMSAADKTTLNALAQAPPAHQHDERYYTEAEVNILLTGYAPATHVGAGGAAHPTVSTTQAGFMTPADKARLDGLVTLPAGMIMPYAGATVPTGWRECNGEALDRVDFAELFTAIGTMYGAGNGSTTFNLPDLRGEFLRGWDHGRGIDDNRTLGSSQSDMLASHTHTIFGDTSGGDNPWGGIERKISTDNGGVDEATPSGVMEHLWAGMTGGAETRPRNLAMMYLIKT